MTTQEEHPVLVLAFTLVGFILAVVLLLMMVGGGFLLALLLLALAAVAAGTLGLASRFTGQPAQPPVATQAILLPSPTPVAVATLDQEARSTLTEGESPAVIIGGLLAGSLVAGVFLLSVMGGGFLLGLLFLVVMLVGAGSLGVAGLVQRRGAAEAATAVPMPVPRAAQRASATASLSVAFPWERFVAWGLAGAAALAAFAFGTMFLMHGFAHTQEDFWHDGLFFLPVIAGFGALVGFAALLQKQGMPVRWGAALLALAGTVVGTGALMSCCVGTLAVLWHSPVLTGLTITLLTYKVTFVAAGVATNFVGVTALTRTGTRPGR
ncbi:MAG: hypothetical protein HY689_12335 [Chloroflexi bacterium]|nr:hypothetical protein [Chloroflexota bacterium]